MADWQNQLLWVFAGAFLTALAGAVGAFLNWRSQRHKILSDNAWADYELRRDLYLEVAAKVDCIFEGGHSSGRPEWHRAARKVRIVGSDEVVRALNALTLAVSSGSHEADARYRDFNLALRQDIRTIRSTPAEGTKLDATAFPIES